MKLDGPCAIVYKQIPANDPNILDSDEREIPEGVRSFATASFHVVAT